MRNATKHLAILCCLLAFFNGALFNGPLQAAIPTQTAWNISTNGASTNGGGYVVGTTATTTNYSLNNNKNAAGCSNCGSTTQDLSTTDAVAVGTTSITSATANFVAAKGNVIYFTGGTGSIAAVRRQVVSVSNVTTIVLDASIAASTGMTMNIGGALDYATAMTHNTPGNRLWVKNDGTYTRTATLTCNNNQTPGDNLPLNWMQGYTTTYGDGGIANITLSTNTGLTAIACAGVAGWYISGFNINCASLGTSNGVTGGYYTTVGRITATNCATSGINIAGQFIEVMDSECTSSVNGSICINVGTVNAATVTRNFVHDMTGSSAVGIKLSNADSSSVIYNTIVNITGTTADAIQASDANNDGQLTIVHNSIYNLTRDGIRLGNRSQFAMNIFDNIIEKTTGCGINESTIAGAPALPTYDGQYFFQNTGGARCNLDDTGAVNPINASGPYTNVHDILGSVSGFVNAAGGDFTPSAAVKGLGNPGTLPGTAGTGHATFGALAPAASSGSANFGTVQ